MVILCLLSQDHYDWGLRAIKSVLVVAGSLKRGDPGSAEDQVLMRALRDFNIPKIVTDDLPVFLGLIGDLFPSLDAPRKRDLNFEKVQAQAFHHCQRWPSPGRVQRADGLFSAPWDGQLISRAFPLQGGQCLLSLPGHP